MGTNYYLVTKGDKTCEHCGHTEHNAEIERHIGKSSCGWYFSMHVYITDGLADYDDWVKHLYLTDMLKSGFIRDEYGTTISTEQMIDIITDREGKNDFTKPYKNPELPFLHFGYDSWEDFHRRNYSESGVNGLLKHSIYTFGDGGCIGHHAELPISYLTCDFS